ncbi:WUSCHEL-related homeobox 10 [Dichanthelium oligosanthes]|uniref:WUSCHEL-related homeobox 10 n=1 Tax=Dichanthelium oligosanthes TaxID=888268 RepID=A0A1E5VIR5_9POAL|nr:WUSCHEL-related homeobox 10 [Dichanthelium oligosanthes]
MDSQHGQAHRSGGGEPTAARSRWAPKPEQILILESIFNSGMVNPAKDETARIRRLLERFGAVRDANVFYWFQNRRSRSRRRARQLQQACGAAAQLPTTGVVGTGHYHGFNDNASPFLMNGHSQVRSSMMPTAAPLPSMAETAPHFFADEVDSGDDLFAISRQMGLMSRGGDHRCGYTANDASQLSYQPTGTASIQVFINGAVYEVPGAGTPLDLAGTFGRDAMLVHSSGEILPVNEHGVLMKSLQMGECYYLVGFEINLISRPAV